MIIKTLLPLLLPSTRAASKKIPCVYCLFFAITLSFSSEPTFAYLTIQAPYQLPPAVHDTVRSLFSETNLMGLTPEQMRLLGQDWQSFYFFLTDITESGIFHRIPGLQIEKLGQPLRIQDTEKRRFPAENSDFFIAHLLERDEAKVTQLKTDLQKANGLLSVALKNFVRADRLASQIGIMGYSHQENLFGIGFRGSSTDLERSLVEDWLGNFGFFYQISNIFQDPDTSTLKQCEKNRAHLQQTLDLDPWRTYPLKNIQTSSLIVLELTTGCILERIKNALEAIYSRHKACLNAQDLFSEKLKNMRWKIAGHSRGGGVAIVAALMLPDLVAKAIGDWCDTHPELGASLAKKIQRNAINSALTQTALVTFAAPKVFYQPVKTNLPFMQCWIHPETPLSDDLSDWFLQNSTHFVSPWDIVPRLAYSGKFRAYVNPGIRIKESTLSNITKKEQTNFMRLFKVFLSDLFFNDPFSIQIIPCLNTIQASFQMYSTHFNENHMAGKVLKQGFFERYFTPPLPSSQALFSFKQEPHFITVKWD
jgi:hypothetical protein